MAAAVSSRVTDGLTPVTEAQRAAILAAPRTSEAHRALMAEVAAMSEVETGGAGSVDLVPQIFTVAAWNLERCLLPGQSADLLAASTPDIVLLTEIDCGVARTAQRHPTAEIAGLMGMHYAYGVEFHELGLGGEIEIRLATDDFNRLGWHGNAVLSRTCPSAVALIRLDDHGHWFVDTHPNQDPGQPRLGGRMAIAAVLPTVAGDICVASVHLESNAGPAHREQQMDLLMDALDGFAPDLPVIIGGDLNTGNSPDQVDWRSETLFDAARARGYSWDNNAAGMTTRPSLFTPNPPRAMKLDWFASRGLSMDGAQIVPVLDSDGVPLSDHELIVGHFAVSLSPPGGAVSQPGLRLSPYALRAPRLGAPSSVCAASAPAGSPPA